MITLQFFDKQKTTSLAQLEFNKEQSHVSSVIQNKPIEFIHDDNLSFKFVNPIFMVGTTVLLIPNLTMQKIEIDEYDIFVKAPIKKSFKIKAKVKSITKLKPKFFIYPDELGDL
ncbi:MAG: hypothetical protein VB079_00725 [Petrimonas sp.]|jgi:hypothetical protein|nr:hypothetical protein [Dysgonamonadaceae bacterium]MDD4697120.1 hypothetical protein [Fermentimonas sp.]MEA4994993.1 hypothetical protein [Petrimonas sp.]MDD3310167.1 hypothetical protein [Dysgonamonadaceae bacterium]MDD3901646.1 hypothetical protein [Dysgonamonadaceae bacterium]